MIDPVKESELMQDNILEARALTKHFMLDNDVVSKTLGKTRVLKAVDGIDFCIKRGQTLGLVGESGCGKSTAARLVTRLVEPTSGEVLVNGENILTQNETEMKRTRKAVQLVFQDPYSSLNPRKTIMEILSRPLTVHKLAHSYVEKRARVLELLELVGLAEEHADRYPHEFSGGQRQRIAIARALAVNPELIIGDEPVSALDVSIQAQILNLLRDLQKRLGLTYLFIAHELSVVRHISDHVAVMYVGKIVESGPVDEIFDNPKHPYTKALLASVPEVDPEASPPELVLRGEVATPIDPPQGCRLCKRCPMADDHCVSVMPELIDQGGEHFVACHKV